MHLVPRNFTDILTPPVVCAKGHRLIIDAAPLNAQVHWLINTLQNVPGSAWDGI